MKSIFSNLAGLATLASSAMAGPFGSRQAPVSRCSTEPNDNFRSLSREMGIASAAGITSQALTNISIPTYFHVISSGETEAEGNLSDQTLKAQLQVINDNYAPHGISFSLVETTRTVNASWSRAPQDYENTELKSALHKGDYKSLNLYFVEERRYLGICNFPEPPTEEVIAQDGCVVVTRSVPGGTAPFDQGKTATHEIGHWFGLFHTFQNQSCSAGGDEVSDTPQQLSATSGCPTGRDSCPGAEGLDPIHNYMDYSDDSCYEEFTAEQQSRMYAMYNQFRTA